MTPRSKATDYEDRFFDLLEGTIKGMDKKVDEVSQANLQSRRELRSLAAKVKRLEKEIFPPLPTTLQQLPPWYRDPAIIKLLTIVAGVVFTLSVIYAGLKGFKIPILGGL